MLNFHIQEHVSKEKQIHRGEKKVLMQNNDQKIEQLMKLSRNQNNKERDTKPFRKGCRSRNHGGAFTRSTNIVSEKNREKKSVTPHSNTVPST